MQPTDVLVVGNGLSGLIAALVAVKRGLSVRVVARGAGALTIGGGCIDLLGSLDGKVVRGDPTVAFPHLSENHPYRLMGTASVKEALAFFTMVCAENNLDFANRTGENLWVPTVLGTFKPTWLCREGMDRETLRAADCVCITHLPWLKEVHAEIVRSELQKQRGLEGKNIIIHPLEPYRAPTYRNLTVLDTARYVDTPEGEAWLLNQLLPLGERAQRERLAILMPPVLGIVRAASIRQRLSEALACPLVEMLAPPPGVGGLRIRNALVGALAKAGVSIVENTHIVKPRVKDGRCHGLFAQSLDRNREFVAKSFVIATGGFFGGGNRATPGEAREVIFGIDLGAPREIADWSAKDIFGPQPYAQLGVRVNARLNALSSERSPLWDNVFFVGRTLAGYDFVSEKSGNGVAVASGYYAGTQV